MTVPIPEIEGKYEILEKLRVGGMGAIYKVRHRLLGDLRVIKVMRPQLMHDPALRKRFHREAMAATRLTHPNIARLYDFSLDQAGSAYIVMEYIEGWGLDALLARRELPPIGLALEIADQSLAALGHLHKKGVVHRDISPDNLMLTRDVDGRPAVKLIDLGLVKSSGSTGQLTASGVFLGKFHYASPEQFGQDQDDPVGPYSDLYSFGLVLYEILTGRYPISGDTPSSLIAGHLFRSPLDFTITDPEHRVPDDLRQVVLGALAKPPEERFSSAEAFSLALEPVRRRYEVDTLEGRRILELIRQPPGPPREPRPGSTQSRFDRHFGSEPTPRPSSPAAAPQGDAADAVESVDAAGWVEEIESKIAEGDFVTARQQLGEAREAVGQTPQLRELGERIDEIEQIARPEARARALRQTRDKIESLEVAGPTLVLQSLQAQIQKGGGDDAAGAPSDRRRANDLVTEARALAQSEDFNAAHDLLRRALELWPDHPEGLILMASVETCRTVRREEARGSENLDSSVETVRGQLEEEPGGADVASAKTTLLDTADEAAFAKTTLLEQQPSAPPPAAPGEDSAAAATVVLPAASGSETVRLATPSHPPEPDASFVTQPHAHAAPEPAATETFLGPRPDAARPDAARPDAARPDAARPDAARPDAARPCDEISLKTIPQQPGHLEEQERQQQREQREQREHHLLDDLTLASTPDEDGGAADSSWGPARGEVPTRSSRRLFVTALVLFVAFLLIGFVLARLPFGATGEKDDLEVEEIASAQLSTALLALDAEPWAEITRIVDSAGQERELPPDVRTPVAFEIEPGTYRVSLAYPPEKKSAEIEVRAEVGEPPIERRVLREVTARELLAGLGSRPPTALTEAAEAFAAGDYEKTLIRAAAGSYSRPREEAYSLLLRAAARHALYALGGEKDAIRHAEAAEEIRVCRQLDAAVEPRGVVYSPRFREFFAAIRQGE